jgi:putative ABC transport system substrate-binding protein
MKRREFITLLGGAAATWPLAAHAQQPDHVRRVGVLMAHAESDPEFQAYVTAFREGLQKLGWTEGRNIQLDFRWGALDDAELRQRAAIELIALKPDLIVTQNTPPTASMLQLTHTIPVVFVVVAKGTWPNRAAGAARARRRGHRITDDPSRSRCPLLAQSGHAVQCPLLGVKRTSQLDAVMYVIFARMYRKK